ncbi:MAG TPA: hypothetical protein DIT04_03875 [Dysgonomonas sp.]|nr:hypothetical protein [Dysgonomonas sp.]
MEKSNITVYEATFRRFLLSILSLITVSVVTGGIGYYGTYPVSYFLVILVFLLLFSIAIVYIVPISYTKKLISFYFIFLIVVLFPLTVFYLSKGIATPIFWYFPIPVFIYTVYSHAKAIRWSFLCAALMLLAFVLSSILRNILYPDMYVHLFYKWLFFGDLINATSSLLTIYLCLFYLHKFQKLRTGQILDSIENSYSIKEEELLDISYEEELKYRQIYAQIEQYFKSKQPYLDPDFKIAQMAHELNTNIVYLAKAIRLNKEMNFNNFVNDYRVEKVKELMRNDARKYTLKHIYLSSGFKNQSSFNKAFKLKEGITPSEYYKQNKLEIEE